VTVATTEDLILHVASRDAFVPAMAHKGGNHRARWNCRIAQRASMEVITARWASPRKASLTSDVGDRFGARHGKEFEHDVV
jgi:hypothetical protein